MRINATVVIDLPIGLAEMTGQLLHAMEALTNPTVVEAKGTSADSREGVPAQLVLTIRGQEDG